MQQTFNPIQDAQIIKQSLSKPRNMESLIQIVTHRSNVQRQEILQSYQDQFQVNLNYEFINNLSGNLKEAMIALFSNPIDYDCYLINKAVEGLGTNEDILIEIIASRSNERLNEIKQRYPQLYNKDVVDVIKSETSGYLQKILITLLQADRPVNKIPNEQECSESAKRLFDSEKGKKRFFI